MVDTIALQIRIDVNNEDTLEDSSIDFSIEVIEES